MHKNEGVQKTTTQKTKTYDLENDNLENDDLENDDLENDDLENDDLFADTFLDNIIKYSKILKISPSKYKPLKLLTQKPVC